MKSLLQQAFEGLIEDGELTGRLSSYSGRFMQGKRCLGYLLGEDENPVEVGSMLMNWIIDTAGDVPVPPDLGSTTLTHETAGMRSDANGRGFVIYWPDMPFNT